MQEIKLKIDVNDIYMARFCEYLYQHYGIFIADDKRTLLAQKLESLMEHAKITSLDEYYHHVVAPPITETQRINQSKFVDTITVHKTNFFRENNHYELIKHHIGTILENSPTAKYTHELRVWSAACSTGEEPYTLAMVLKEVLPPEINPKILATDVSAQCLQTAMLGEYKLGLEDEISPYLKQKYFERSGVKFKICDELKKYVTFRLFNLMQPFPFKNPFDIIFCKNVMIYFDRDIQEQLINKFYTCTSEKGLLFIGHSESLMQLKQNFKYLEPTVYQK